MASSSNSSSDCDFALNCTNAQNHVGLCARVLAVSAFKFRTLIVFVSETRYQRKRCKTRTFPSYFLKFCTGVPKLCKILVCRGILHCPCALSRVSNRWPTVGRGQTHTKLSTKASAVCSLNNRTKFAIICSEFSGRQWSVCRPSSGRATLSSLATTFTVFHLFLRRIYWKTGYWPFRR